MDSPAPQSDPRTGSTFQTRQLQAYLVLLFMPLFFSSNIVIGRAIIGESEPFLLAFLRWSITSIILILFSYQAVKQAWPLCRGALKEIIVLGFLGMWICGALVYLALKYTSASNGTLIYTSSSVLIILLEWLFRGRRVGWREIIGVPLAIFGVVVIVIQGNLTDMLDITFNPGDLLFVLSAASWAVYSVLIKREPFNSVGVFPLLGVIAGVGALTLLPFAAWELASTEVWPLAPQTWSGVAGLVVLSSIIPFSAYQFGVKIIGPSVTGVFLYLLPPYGVGLAVWLLGETLQPFHFAGFALILTGVVLATYPTRKRRNR